MGCLVRDKQCMGLWYNVYLEPLENRVRLWRRWATGAAWGATTRAP